MSRTLYSFADITNLNLIEYMKLIFSWFYLDRLMAPLVDILGLILSRFLFFVIDQLRFFLIFKVRHDSFDSRGKKILA